MGNAAGSLFSGLGQVVGNALGHPLDFLSGQSCKSICSPTWEIACYIENFCVAQLLKFVMVAMLVCFVLLLLCLLYNLGICQCIWHTLCRVVWACLATCFSSLNFCCTSLCYKLRTVKRTRRRRRKRDIENMDVGSTTSSCSSTSGGECELDERSKNQQPGKNLEHRRWHFSRRRNYKDEHLRRALRANNHRTRVEYSGHGGVHMHRKRALKNNIGDVDSRVHNHIRVTRSSRFSQKGARGRNRIRRIEKVDTSY